MNPHERENSRAVAPAESDWGSRSHMQTLILIGATGFGLYLCFRLTLPFLPALAWALALAVIFAPLQRWLESKLQRPGLAAAISVLTAGLIVVVPTMFVGERLIHEAAKGADLVQKKVESGEWRHALEAHPRLVPLADWMERQNVPATVKALAVWMTTTGASFVRGSVGEVLGLIVTFYLLFFFLRDRQAALQLLRSRSPFSEAEINRLMHRVTDTVYATMYGTLAVAAVQGLLGGLMFWWLGLSSPLLWGVVMALLAVIPVVGAYVVWIPAAMFLALNGHWGKAVILTVWGGAVVGTIDNLLLSVLVGRRLKLHTILAFISVIGGLMVFGASGLILGPVVLTVTAELLEIWRHRTSPEIVARAEAEELSRFENEGGHPAAPEPGDCPS